MKQRNDLESNVATIVIDENWSYKAEVEARKAAAEKALSEYKTKLASFQTTLSSVLDKTDQKTALDQVKKDLEEAQKDQNNNIDKAISEAEGALSMLSFRSFCASSKYFFT